MENEIKIIGLIADDAKIFSGLLEKGKTTVHKIKEVKSIKEKIKTKSKGDTSIQSQADLDRWYSGTVDNTRIVCSISSSFNTGTMVVTPLVNAWNNYVAFLNSLPDTIEYPNTSANQQKVQIIRQKEVEIQNCFNYGDNTVYNNFAKELNTFERHGIELENSRNAFENSPSSTNNITRIQNAMQAVLNQNNLLGQFSLVSSPRTTAIFQRHNQLITRFSKVYFTDEIDRLRQEYITYNVAVPKRNEFVNSVAGSSYSFAELNFGEYRYAILNSRMIAGLEGVKNSLGSKIVVTSGYRNPKKQVTTIGGSANSQHCYGTAIDLRTSNNQALWNKVAKAACQAGANWVEPQAQSTLDHVHADWRGTNVGSSYCNTTLDIKSEEVFEEI
jgi:uncharacterized protein YcbK (DUF882 family)